MLRRGTFLPLRSARSGEDRSKLFPGTIFSCVRLVTPSRSPKYHTVSIVLMGNVGVKT